MRDIKLFSVQTKNFLQILLDTVVQFYKKYAFFETVHIARYSCSPVLTTTWTKTAWNTEHSAAMPEA